MRYLILLRHAKAVASSPDGDFARELSPRGRRQAPLIAKWLSSSGFGPDHVVFSPARRTRETMDLMLPELGAPVTRTEVRELYNADADTILDIVRATAVDVRNLMLVGHNPGIAEVAFFLAGRGEHDARGRLANGFPTCACAVIAFDGATWADTNANAGALAAFATPRSLDESGR